MIFVEIVIGSVVDPGLSPQRNHERGWADFLVSARRSVHEAFVQKKSPVEWTVTAWAWRELVDHEGASWTLSRQ